MEHNGFRQLGSYRATSILIGVIASAAVITSWTAGGSALATPMPTGGTPFCEEVGVSGDITGPEGPYGGCFPNPDGLPMNCTTTTPSVGTLVALFVEVCVVD